MTELVETLIEDARWEGLDLAALAETAARATLAVQGLAAEGFLIGLMGCDDVRIAGLNGEFRQKGVATNVLSFPSENRAAPVPGSSSVGAGVCSVGRLLAVRIRSSSDIARHRASVSSRCA